MSNERTPRRGVLLIVASPSGAGKTSLCRRLMADHGDLELSISMTTRAIRPGEVADRDYHFVSEAEFDRLIQNDAFLEWADVHGHRYGSPRAPVERALAEGRDVLFDIDWQGTQQLKEKARDDVVSIFILPPSRAELERRLLSRAQDTPEIVRQRMAKANDELSHWAEYDYVILNDDVHRAEARIAGIVEAERHKRVRQTGLSEFVRGLMT